MTHPDIEYAEIHGYGPWQCRDEEPAIFCEECGEGICEGEEYYDIGGGVCESCADLLTWFCDEDAHGKLPECCQCGATIEHDETYLGLPNGDGDFCGKCLDGLRRTAWAA